MGALSDVTVLELGNFIAGPFAGQILGDHGARVIKVEAPGTGDPMRRWGPTLDDEGVWWPSIARNKESVVIDLRTELGRDVVRRIATSVDVVVENFKPGRLESWGLGYSELSALNPRLILVRVSGYGQTGPMAQQAGFGSIGEAMGGVRHTTGEPDRLSARTGISLGDSLAALFAVVGTLSALHERERSGIGQEVDVAIYEAVAALMESTMADYERLGVTRGRTGSILPGVAPANAYPTADGSGVVIAANADRIFTRLCAAMGRPDLATDARFLDHGARGTNLVELDTLIAEWTSALPTEVLLERLEANSVPAGRIFTAPDMIDDPQYRARGMVLRIANAAGVSAPFAGVVPKLSRTPGEVVHGGPRLGEHTRRVLTSLGGIDDNEYRALVDKGVVFE